MNKQEIIVKWYSLAQEEWPLKEEMEPGIKTAVAEALSGLFDFDAEQLSEIAEYKIREILAKTLFDIGETLGDLPSHPFSKNELPSLSKILSQNFSDRFSFRVRQALVENLVQQN